MMAISNIYNLVSRAIPGRTTHDLFRKFRVLMYALINPFAARIWLKALTTNALLADMAIRNRRFLERPFRCFAQANMSAYARAELLCGHFAVVRDLFGTHIVHRLYLNSHHVTLASNGRYALVVSEPVRCWREGSLTVAWHDAVDNVDLAWATISFEQHAASGARGVLIGGLQGPSDAGRDRVRDATRSCHGLRPKAAVMEAVWEIGRMAKIDSMTAVTNKTHVSAATAIQFSANYDAFWGELGGIAVDGRFTLPLRPYHRDIGDVPSNKRAAFRKRQELIAGLIAQINQAINEGANRVQQRYAKIEPHLPALAIAPADNYGHAEPA